MTTPMKTRMKNRIIQIPNKLSLPQWKKKAESKAILAKKHNSGSDRYNPWNVPRKGQT